MVAAASLGLQAWLAYVFVRHAVIDTLTFFRAVDLRRIEDQTSQLRPAWLKHPTLAWLSAAAVAFAVAICVAELARGVRAAVRDDEAQA